MFPEDDIDFDLDSLIETQQTSLGKSYLFDFENNEFVLRGGKFVEIEGQDVLKQWIEKCVRTEKNKFKVYNDETYGAPTEELLRNRNMARALAESEFERELTESLQQHFMIQDVANFEWTRDNDKLEVHFDVITKDGTSVEVEFDVWE